MCFSNSSFDMCQWFSGCKTWNMCCSHKRNINRRRNALSKPWCCLFDVSDWKLSKLRKSACTANIRCMCGWRSHKQDYAWTGVRLWLVWLYFLYIKWKVTGVYIPLCTLELYHKRLIHWLADWCVITLDGNITWNCLNLGSWLNLNRVWDMANLLIGDGYIC